MRCNRSVWLMLLPLAGSFMPLLRAPPRGASLLRMIVEDDLAEEAARVAAIVEEASRKQQTKKKAVEAATSAGAVDVGAVDVDLMLALNDADAQETDAEADAVFEVLDTNGDGKISLEELESHLFGSGYSKAAITSMFETLDANSDGGISREELRTGFGRYASASLRLALGLAAGSASRDRPLQRLDGLRTSLADELFDAIDVNGDGEISSKEMLAHMGGSFSQRYVDAIFTAIDVNNDGRISRDELRKCFAQYEFSALRVALGLPQP